MSLCDCFSTINTVSHFDRVQINFHDTFFPPNPFDQDGEISLDAFAQISPSGPEKHVLGSLLRDSARSSYTFAFFGIGTSFLNLYHIETVMVEKKIVFRSHDRLYQWLGNLLQRHPFVFQLDGLAIPHLFVDADEHQRSVVNRYELICHHSQQTGNKQEQQQVPASYQYFFQYAHRFLSFRTANLRIYFQYCSICSSVLPFVSGTNFQINKAARTPMTP